MVGGPCLLDSLQSLFICHWNPVQDTRLTPWEINVPIINTANMPFKLKKLITLEDITDQEMNWIS